MDTDEYLHESYDCFVYYDFLDDDICYESRYRFLTKELAEQFKNDNCNKDFIIITDVIFNDKHIKSKNTIYCFKPIFDNLKDANDDLNDFINNMFDNSYKYYDTINFVNLDIYSNLSLTCSNNYLKDENDKLKDENGKLKDENEFMKKEIEILKNMNLLFIKK
jgi:hypothetical protein